MRNIFFLALISIFFISCNNEVDLTSDYVDTTVVYGLLNPGENTHYVRIQKAYLVNGNALDYAKVPDSIQYNPSDLTVVIEERDSTTDVLKRTIALTPVIGAEKDTGIFASTNHVIYKTPDNEKIFSQFVYKLVITNNKTGKVITGKTKLVKNTVADFFKTPGAGSVNWNSPIGTGYTMRWNVVGNGKIYQPEVVFYFKEVNVVTGDTIQDSLAWRFVAIEYNPQLNADIMELNVPQNSFYEFVGNRLSPKPNIKRIIGWLNFKCYIGTDDLNTYINVNKPSIGIIQEKPLYTNITNGIGIFAARSSYIKRLVPLSEQSKDTLIFGKYTQNLSFFKN